MWNISTGLMLFEVAAAVMDPTPLWCFEGIQLPVLLNWDPTPSFALLARMLEVGLQGKNRFVCFCQGSNSSSGPE